MSEVKVNKISPRTNCGTVQLGDSGDTITIPAGATITNNGTAAGFGSTGEVSWDTTKKTASFTGVSGVGYFVDTSSSAITVTLPASPSAGNVVAVADYTGTAATNSITIGRNSSNINGAAEDFVLEKNNTTVQFIYVDATEGWRLVFTGSLSSVSPSFIEASGGTETTCGNFKIHTFTGPGTFTVSDAGDSGLVSYMVVAGGAGTSNASRNEWAGGGGAGGFREGKDTSDTYTASPLATTALTVSAQDYPITVGGGGSASSNGSTSSFSTISSAGGGTGGAYVTVGTAGGSGGGGGGDQTRAGGAGNTPPVSPPQGQNGGDGKDLSPEGGGGGGGAIDAGGNGVLTGAGGGGNGAPTFINPSPSVGTPGPAPGRYFSGGGGGGNGRSDIGPTPTTSSGGAGGGGTGGGGNNGPTPLACGTNGTANTGGGGGATGGKSGGSGIVVIRYKFQ